MFDFDWLHPITARLGQFVDRIAHEVSRAASWVTHFLSLWPRWAVILLVIALGLAVVGVLLSHGLAVWRHCHAWKPKPHSQLTYSYACGTGPYQRGLMYQEAHKLLRDHTWSWVSASGLAYRLGNLTHQSRIVVAFGSVIYLPLVILGLVEMILRVIIGTVWLLIASLAQRLVLMVLRWLSYVGIALGKAIDKSARVEQYCWKCYQHFDLPDFVCPGCGQTISELIPARTGVLVARCQCGRFLPTLAHTGRSRLAARCPSLSCGAPLVGANAKQFTIVLIGGNKSGKTAFASAFQHQYMMHHGANRNLTLFGAPTEAFAALEQAYSSGMTESSDSSAAQVYHIGHEVSGTVRDTLVLYDVPDEAVFSGVFEKNPLYLAYADGIVIIVDPLSMASVRQECQTLGDTVPSGSYSTDDVDDLIQSFEAPFSAIVNRAARRRSDIPVAIIVNKTDVKAVKRKIGAPKITATYNANPGQYGQDPAAAANDLVRAYLTEIGLSNAIANLEKAFSVVRFFPTSAIGHASSAAAAFSPVGVIAPIAWIAQQSRSRLASTLADAQGEVTK